jgi:hypothetical protein
MYLPLIPDRLYSAISRIFIILGFPAGIKIFSRQDRILMAMLALDEKMT